MSTSSRCFPRIRAQATMPMPSSADSGCGRKTVLVRTLTRVRSGGPRRRQSFGRALRMDARSETSHREPPAWQALEAHQQAMRSRHLRDLFALDPSRGERMTAEAAGVFLDYSKNRIDDETLALLVDLAEQSGLRGRIDAMFRGEKINATENRAALHVALRAPRGASIIVDGKNVVPAVHAVLDKMAAFTRRVRGGEWK